MRDHQRVTLALILAAVAVVLVVLAYLRGGTW